MSTIYMISESIAHAQLVTQRRRHLRLFGAQVIVQRRAAVERAQRRVRPRRRITEGYAAGLVIGMATGALWGFALVLRGWIG